MSVSKISQSKRRNDLYVGIKRGIPIYLLILPTFIQVIVFCYIPISGYMISFKNYDVFKGFWRSPWADQFGMANIISIFHNQPLLASIWNTLLLSILNLLVTFPTPIILALMINELKVGPFKKSVQTISYMPQFLSWISVIGIILVFFGEYGPLNDFLNIVMGEDRARVMYLAEQKNFLPLLLGVNLWKTLGWSSIIYIATIASIDPQLYEAAVMDGAGKWKQMIYITIPGLSVVAILLFVLSIGNVLNSNFELVFGLQNPFIDFETIDTVIYKNGLLQRSYSVATALGFVRGMIGVGLTLAANIASKRVNKVSIL